MSVADGGPTGDCVMKTCVFLRNGTSLLNHCKHPLSIVLALACSWAIAKEKSERAPSTAHKHPLSKLERREKWEQSQRTFPLPQIPHGARERALKQIEAADAGITAEASSSGSAWFELGPAPIHDITSPDAAGRVSAIAVDPFARSEERRVGKECR